MARGGEQFAGSVAFSALRRCLVLVAGTGGRSPCLGASPAWAPTPVGSHRLAGGALALGGRRGPSPACARVRVCGTRALRPRTRCGAARAFLLPGTLRRWLWALASSPGACHPLGALASPCHVRPRSARPREQSECRCRGRRPARGRRQCGRGVPTPTQRRGWHESLRFADCDLAPCLADLLTYTCWEDMTRRGLGLLGNDGALSSHLYIFSLLKPQ